MRVRIRFASEIYFEGENLEEIKEKWESVPLFSKELANDNYASYLEIEDIENADTHEDLINEFDSLY